MAKSNEWSITSFEDMAVFITYIVGSRIVEKSKNISDDTVITRCFIGFYIMTRCFGEGDRFTNNLSNFLGDIRQLIQF